MKFDLILADPPWKFGDSLTMSSVKRGASSQYSTLTAQEIAEMGYLVKKLSKDDAALVLWVPDSMLEDGLRVMRVWGFKQKQIVTWVKTGASETRLEPDGVPEDLAVGFGMGRIFRCCNEHALIGTHGSPQVASHSQRNLVLAPNLKHSAKPRSFIKVLDSMWPHPAKKLELFARNTNPGWVSIGNECHGYEGVDIRTALQALIADES